MKFAVNVMETFRKTVVVEAKDAAEALEKAETAMIEGKITVDDECYGGTDVELCSNYEGGIISDEQATYYDILQ